MTDTIHNTILPMTDTTAEPEDYTGEDGLLYCGKCRKPKEAYFPEGKTFFGDRKSTRLNSSHLKLSRMPSSA